METNMMGDKKDGFTIVEVIITIVVGSILLFGLAAMVNSIFVINARAHDTILVNSLIEDKVEELRSNTFASLSDGTVDFANELPDSITEGRSATYTVSAVTGNLGLKEVEFNVSYNDYGSTVYYNYKTFIGELGVGQY